MTNNPFNNNLPNQVSLICDMIDKKPRIVQAIQVCNEEKFVEACLLQLYDKVDKIIIIEGAVQNKVKAGQATEDGHSLDNTVEIINSVKANKDPDNKITFVQIDRPWVDLEEIKNTFFNYMQDGDWMLITDADEFLMPEVVDKLRKAISLEPFATEIVPGGFYHFWRDAYHMRVPSGDWGQQHQRFIKYQSGLHYVNHPVARDANGICTYFDARYIPRRFVMKDFVYYHYSYCQDRDDDIRAKKEFYQRELGQEKHGDAGAYARGGQTDEYVNRLENLDTVLRFTGEHPPIIRDHIVSQYRDEVLASSDLRDYTVAQPYSLGKIPLIWIYAYEGRKPYDKIYQMVEV